MREKPILFSTEMVRAILEGRKSQTRRVVNASGKATAFKIAVMPDGTKMPFGIDEEEAMLDYIKCPYGKPGDRLWVRETWYQNDYNEALLFGTKWCYKADIPDGNHPYFKWKPSIFMPHEACRITLEVTDVAVKRLNIMSDQDCIAEGIEPFGIGYKDYSEEGCSTDSEYYSYKTLWESINGKGSWDKNPWVWVITFKSVQP